MALQDLKYQHRLSVSLFPGHTWKLYIICILGHFCRGQLCRQVVSF